MEEINIRKIESRVDISYGNEDIADTLEYASENKSEISRFENLYNNNHTPAEGLCAFTLEGNSLSEGRNLIDPNIVGWWSSAFSGTSASSVGGYAFSKIPKIRIDFGKERPIKVVEIFSDPNLKEYPVKINIRLFTKTSDAESAEQKVFDRTFINGEAYDVEEKRIRRIVNLLTDASEKSTDAESFSVENGYIVGIYAMTVSILEWNKPGRVSKIYRCYDDIVERYMQDELKTFECVYELANAGEIQYGLVSGSCSVTLLNNKGRKFDLGYLKKMAHINKRVMPYVNGERMGTYYIKEWEISQDDMFVRCKGNDRLLDFQNIVYEGKMPAGETPAEQKKTFKTLFEEVLNYANTFFVTKFTYAVDENLGKELLYEGQDLTKIEPYLPRESVWAVLQTLCEASLSFVYADRNGVIRVKSELTEDTAEKNCAAQINTSNAFAINIPFFADMAADSVDIPYYEKKIGETEELCSVAALPGVLNYEVQFNDFVEVERVEFICKDDDLNKILDIYKVADFIYATTISAEQSNAESPAIQFFGKKTSFEKKNLGGKTEEMTAYASPSLYKHADCRLVQGKAPAKKIAERVTAVYKQGTRSSDADWRGTEKLGLFDAYSIADRFGGEALYSASYIKNTIDGGFRQEVKGIQKRVIKEGKMEEV